MGTRASLVHTPPRPLADWLRVSEARDLPGQCLGFLMCEMRMRMALPLSTVRRIRWLLILDVTNLLGASVSPHVSLGDETKLSPATSFPDERPFYGLASHHWGASGC